jgi:hypothetical protein
LEANQISILRLNIHWNEFNTVNFAFSKWVGKQNSEFHVKPSGGLCGQILAHLPSRLVRWCIGYAVIHREVKVKDQGLIFFSG